jgi:tetratricopeptide (TPR) repeat protein
LINAYLQKDDVEKAIETGEKLVKMAPDFALGQNNLAFAYYMQENFKKAIEYLDKAVSLGFDAHPDFLKKLDVYRNA